MRTTRRRRIRRGAERPSATPEWRSRQGGGFGRSLPGDQLTASQVLELYRLCWQIELAFKRLKSLWDLGSAARIHPIGKRRASSRIGTQLLPKPPLIEVGPGFRDFAVLDRPHT